MSRLYEALQNARAEIGRIQPDSTPLAVPEPRFLSIDAAAMLRLAHSVETLLKRPRKVIVVMSCRAGEGASTIAHGFARFQAASTARTVLLVETAALGRRAAVEGQAGLTVAAFPTAEVGLLDRQSLRQHWERLRQRFDLVVVDAPPVLESTLGLTLAPTVDGVVLVLAAEETLRRDGVAARDAVLATGANLLGAVLNKRRRYLPRVLDDLM